MSGILELWIIQTDVFFTDPSPIAQLQQMHNRIPKVVSENELFKDGRVGLRAEIRREGENGVVEGGLQGLVLFGTRL